MVVCEYKEKKAANQGVSNIYNKQINKQRRKREGKEMELELYWFDKNWKKRGEGRNAHLIINYTTKTYKYFTSYILNGYNYNSIQVLRKGDLEEYMRKLDAEGFDCIN